MLLRSSKLSLLRDGQPKGMPVSIGTTSNLISHSRLVDLKAPVKRTAITNLADFTKTLRTSAALKTQCFQQC